jgi:hypothetical protein
VSDKAGQINQLVRTLGTQLKDAFSRALGLKAHNLPPLLNHRALVVDKVSRNAVAELVNQAKAHPQRGDLGSANPAYVSLAQLGQNLGINGLALGLKNETGEIAFLDFDLSPAAASAQGSAYFDRKLNKILWRQLKKLTALNVDRNMLGPRKPILSPEDAPDNLIVNQKTKPAKPENQISATTIDIN